MDGINDTLNIQPFFVHLLVMLFPNCYVLFLKNETRMTKRRSRLHQRVEQKMSVARKLPPLLVITVLSRLHVDMRESQGLVGCGMMSIFAYLKLYRYGVDLEVLDMEKKAKKFFSIWKEG